ncbi:MAG: SMC-Scp complex subunit ScpB [archaeon]|nr:SMC-Scp complex subunit ScpB [archaeon]
MDSSFTAKSQEQLDDAEDQKSLKKVEAALFISARYLSVPELVELTDINPLLLRELLEKLRETYQKDDTSIEILNKDEFWKMDIRQEYFDMINKLATGKAEFTKAEQETLAIVAYKQPVKQSVIIKIRGNKGYDHVRHFIDIGLIKSKRVGHTLELNLSESFYDYFHLEKKGKDNIEKEREEVKEESE